MCPYPPQYSHGETQPETELEPEINPWPEPRPSTAMGNAHTAVNTLHDAKTVGAPQPPYDGEIPPEYLIITEESGVQEDYMATEESIQDLVLQEEISAQRQQLEEISKVWATAGLPIGG